VLALREVGWADGGDKLAAIRRRVFIEEQHVPEALEWDDLDGGALHLLAFVDGNLVGCARLLPGGRIGRMAVLPEWRRQGVGGALLQALIASARRQGLQQVTLSAQVHAIPFYQHHGFSICGDIYPDAGIPHRDMTRKC